MHYRIYGTAHRTKVAFLHGFMGEGQDFEGIAEALSAHCQCLLLDLPGHGQTATQFPTQQYDMATTAASLLDVLRSLQFIPCHVVGYSMGGRLALYWALHYPEACLSLVLESATPGFATDPERRQRQQQDEQLAQNLETLNWSTFLDQWYAQTLFDPLRQTPAFSTVHQRRQHNHPRALAQVLRQMGTGVQPSLWERLSTLTQPTRLMVGAMDHKFVALNQQMSAHIPQVYLDIIPGCGHVVHLENPGLFTASLHSHLARTGV